MTTDAAPPPLIEIVLNGQPRLVAPSTSLDGLIDLLGVQRKGTAIAVDGEVVPRSRWAASAVSVGAHVEVVTAAAGG